MNALGDRSNPARRTLEDLMGDIQRLVLENGYFLQDMTTSMSVHASPDGGAVRSISVSFEILDPPANVYAGNGREILNKRAHKEPRKTNRYDLLKGTSQ